MKPHITVQLIRPLSSEGSWLSRGVLLDHDNPSRSRTLWVTHHVHDASTSEVVQESVDLIEDALRLYGVQLRIPF